MAQIANGHMQGMMPQTNQQWVKMLSDGQQNTPAGESLANWLTKHAGQLAAGGTATQAAASYLANVISEKSFTPATWFFQHPNFAADLWSLYQTALKSRLQPATESVQGKPKVKTPKLVRRDGHLTDAGLAVVTYLDEQYLSNKLPVSQSTRVYVAHRHVMGLSAEKTLRDNQSIHAGLCETFTRLAMREIAEIRAELDNRQ